MPKVRLVVAAAAVASVLAVFAGPASPAGAVSSSPQATLVATIPTPFTPNVNNGVVLTMVQVGTRIIVGGSFTSVSPPRVNKGAQAITRNYLLAFDAGTGLVDPTFTPALDGVVEALAAGPTSDTVYVGGAFNTVNGVGSKGVTLISTVTGTIVPGFTPVVVDGIVWSVVLTSGHLLIGGAFTTVGGAPHSGLASLDRAR